MDYDLPIDTLLAHEGFLRRVVVELVDEHEAEDLLQETWAAALRKGPARLIAPRAFLRRVAVNLALRHRRGAARRRQREATVARDESLASTDAMVERLHAHRLVAQAVADLPEPYRSAVLLRFFEDLSPREIARRLELNGSTVRSRIDRGLQLLRGRLEGTGVRSLAAVILCPRLGEPAVPAGAFGPGLPFSIGVLAMTLRHPVVATTLLLSLLATGTYVVAGLSAGAPAEPPAPLVAAATNTDVSPSAAVAAPAPEVRTVTPAPVATPARPPLRGRVLDPRGKPLAGVPVLFAPSATASTVVTGEGMQPLADGQRTEAAGASDAEGRFSFACEHDHGQLYAGGDFVTLRSFNPRVEKRAQEQALLVVAPKTTARGRVVNWLGLPLSGVSVAARLDGLMEMDASIGHANQVALPATVTDALGGFAFDRLPLLPELELQFDKTGYKTERRHELGAGADLRVKLRTLGNDVWTVSGTVLDEAGRLVPGATVFLHQTLAKTGKFGEFTVETRYLTEESQLLAGLPGTQIAARPDVVADLLKPGAGRLRTGVVFRLGGPALGVAGQVVDQEGAPVPDLVVTLLDVRGVGAMHTVEDFVAGVESKVGNVGKAICKVDARTDAEGRFAIEGLEPRGYRLRIFAPDTLAGVTVPVTAGANDVLVRLPALERRDLSGVVRSRGGTPLAGIRVSWGLETFKGARFRMFAPGGHTETDADGRFALRGVPSGDVELGLSGEAIVDLQHPLHGVPDGDELTIEAAARCRFRVEVEDPKVTTIRVLDAAGEALEVQRRQGQISYSGDSWSVKRGRTPVLEVSELARTLVLLADDAEVARHAVQLGVSGVQVLRY